MPIKHENLAIVPETRLASFQRRATQAWRYLVIENALSSGDSIDPLRENDFQIDNLPLRHLSRELKKILAEWEMVKNKEILEILSNIVLCPDDSSLIDLKNCEIIQMSERSELIPFPIEAMRKHCDFLKTPKLVRFSSRSSRDFEKTGVIIPINIKL